MIWSFNIREFIIKKNRHIFVWMIKYLFKVKNSLPNL